jgi:UDP-N-acetylglucosamine transferase subunit ALG13
VDILMILVTLGTQDKSFVRLLNDIEKQIEIGNINDEVIVQAGYTKFQSNKMKIFDLIDRDEFGMLISKCDLLITHGGVGSILSGIKNGKKVIACPRLAKYKEHINNHQKQIIDKFSDSGYILAYNEGDDLGKILKMVKKFKPKKYVSNTDNMIKIIDDFISSN